jgi:hypothetical protein
MDFHIIILISEYNFCNIKPDEDSYPNSSGLHNDIYCWNNSKTFNNRSYQVSLICLTRCISSYRIRDSIRDCYRSEEGYSLNNSCPQIQHHRFQCSSSEWTCLLVGTIGSGDNECSNERDEFDSEGEIALSTNIHCKGRTDQRCIYFQNYIRMSSSNHTKEELINNNSLIDVKGGPEVLTRFL